MWRSRTEGRRKSRRAFRPTVETSLESRTVPAPFVPGLPFIQHPQLGFAYAHNNPPFLSYHAPRFPRAFSTAPHFAEFTAHGGQRVRVVINGGAFDISLSEFVPTSTTATTNPTTLQTTSSVSQTGETGVQVKGTVRAYPMPGGKVGIIVDGTNELTELDINPVPFHTRKGYAHSFAYGFAGRQRILNVGSLLVSSGQIGAILGYHTADLSGPLTNNGNGNIDRIAFDAFLPGAKVTTGGDINTLDSFRSANFVGTGTGIMVGRDLNFFNIGGDMTFSNGANFFVARDLGQVPQPAKGTETGIASASSTLTNQLNAGGLIQGNLYVGPGSSFVIGRAISDGNPGTPSATQPAVLDIRGNLQGVNHVSIPNARLVQVGQLPPNVIIEGTISST